MAQFDFEGSVAIVTGAAAGIGRATARLLAEDGAYVVGLDVDATPRDDGPAFEEAVDRGTLVVGDVTDADDVDRAVDAAADRGAVDVVVNNAGVGGNGMLHEIARDDWERTLAVHVGGTYTVCKRVLPAMADRGAGAVVNVSSIAGIGGYPATADYSAAKGGVTSLTRQLAVDYSGTGVRVNAVAPGFVKTAMNAAVWRERAGREGGMDYDTATERTLLPRLGDPEDVADAVRFLASDAAGFVTGHVMPVDGGWSCW
jgi:NAD(P)-dependent dehydrogenase (short-subunit alcohol dehydrogenase family)